GPVSAHLGTKRLVIVSEGALQYMSFAALPSPETERRREGEKERRREGETERRRDGQRETAANTLSLSRRPLVLDHEIINLPSASMLAVLRKELAGRPLAPKTAAVLADPVFEPTDLRVKHVARTGGAAKSNQDKHLARLETTRSFDDLEMKSGGRLYIPRLPYSQGEAEAIKRLVPESMLRVAKGFEVNYGAATAPDLENYRIVHFATHSLLNGKHPELSGVLLSLVDEEGRPQEPGILSLGDVYNLKLPAELVVLSACQTALGKDVKGEGLIGVTRGFMYAGAARVMASLWKADDEATAELMKLLYEGMLGKQQLRPVEALRRAQIAMWRSRSSWSAPYYWAAFTLQGE